MTLPSSTGPKVGDVVKDPLHLAPGMWLAWTRNADAWEMKGECLRDAFFRTLVRRDGVVLLALPGEEAPAAVKPAPAEELPLCPRCDGNKVQRHPAYGFTCTGCATTWKDTPDKMPLLTPGEVVRAKKAEPLKCPATCTPAAPCRRDWPDLCLAAAHLKSEAAIATLQVEADRTAWLRAR